MGIRFRKSLKIAPGVKFNINKKSVGLTIGTRGAHASINSKGRRTTSVGIPGTGLSYTSISSQKSAPLKSTSKSKVAAQEEIKDIVQSAPSEPHGPILKKEALTYTLHVKFKPSALQRLFGKKSSSEDYATNQDLLHWQQLISPEILSLTMSPSELENRSEEILKDRLEVFQSSRQIIDHTLDIDIFFKNYQILLTEFHRIAAFSPYITIDGQDLDVLAEYENDTYVKSFIDKVFRQLTIATNISRHSSQYLSLQLAFKRYQSIMTLDSFSYYIERDNQYCN